MNLTSWVRFYYQNIHWTDVLKMMPMVVVVTQLTGWVLAVGILALVLLITVQMSAMFYGMNFLAALEIIDVIREEFAKATGGTITITGADDTTTP